MRKRESALIFFFAMVIAACIGSLGDMVFGQAAPTWWSWTSKGWDRPTYYALIIAILVFVVWLTRRLLKPNVFVEIESSYSKIKECDILILGLSKPGQFTLDVSDHSELLPIQIVLCDPSADIELRNRLSAVKRTSKDDFVPTTLEGVVTELVRQINVVSQSDNQSEGMTRASPINFQIQLNLFLHILQLPRSKWPSHVIFVGSTGDDGSALAYQGFIEGLRKLESSITFDLIPVEFLDLTQIFQTLEARVNEITRGCTSKWRDRSPRIVVDSNGMGQAYSIAAALFSMKRRCVLTYYRHRLELDHRSSAQRNQPTNLDMFVYDLRTIDRNSILHYFV